MATFKRFPTKYAGVFYIEGQSIGTSKPEKIYYIRYRKDGKSVEEKVGRQFQDDMTPARASGIRVRKIDGELLTNTEEREKVSFSPFEMYLILLLTYWGLVDDYLFGHCDQITFPR